MGNNKTDNPFYKEVLECFRRSRGVYSVGPFRSSSGKLAPLGVDFVKVYSCPEHLNIIGKALNYIFKQVSTGRELICGVATAGIPLAVALSLESNLSYVYARSVRDKRTGDVIQGNYRRGQGAVLIDDIIVTGRTKEEVLKLIDGELVIDQLITLLEPGPGYARDVESFSERNGVIVHSLVEWLTVTELMIDSGVLPKRAGELMVDYLKNPEAWQDDEGRWEHHRHFMKKNNLGTGDLL